MKGFLSLLGLAVFSGAFSIAAHFKDEATAPVFYKVLPPISKGNLTVFPVVASTTFDTALFLTLDEGIHSGDVIVTETGGVTGLVRPRPPIVNDGVWRERPFPVLPPSSGAQVNQLSLVNNADRPLLLLAGEIVTGGKQDRVVSKDLIIPAHSQPVALGVFCVEPHRWTETSAQFGTAHSFMAQPSVRSKAMAEKNQQQVWDEVARSRSAIIAGVPAAAPPVSATSSYATSIGNRQVQAQIDTVAKPLEESYDALIQKLHEQHAVGAVIAVNGAIVWSDVFASSDLLNRFWPKLVRSYAAESFTWRSPNSRGPLSEQKAQAFLDGLGATHETVETEPGLYRQTEIDGANFTAFVLTSLLPKATFDVHVAKMVRY